MLLTLITIARQYFLAVWVLLFYVGLCGLILLNLLGQDHVIFVIRREFSDSLEVFSILGLLFLVLAYLCTVTSPLYSLSLTIWLLLYVY